MAVATGVVPDLRLTAVVATTGMSAQVRRAAGGQGFERLLDEGRYAASSQILAAVPVNHVGDFDAGASAGGCNGVGIGSTGSQSKGLVIACSRGCRTCR